MIKASMGAIAVLACLAALPASASAAFTYFASPGGGGTECTTALPCTVQHALAISASGDTVVMSGNEGTYGSLLTPIGSELQVHGGISLEGATGQPMPQIYSNASGAGIRMEGGTGQRLRDVAIHYGGVGAALNGAGTIERVLALGTIAGCELGPETVLVDSVCAGELGIYDNVGGFSPWPLTLRNDTIYGTERGLTAITGSAGLQLNVFNTVIHGGLSDILANQGSPGTVTVVLDHSNYASVTSEGGASVTAAGSGTNQTAAPVFVNAAAFDFAEQASSPTIDAGANDAANGTLDVIGNPRTSNVRGTCKAMTDIGAYELNTGLVVDCFGPPPPPKKEPTKKIKPGKGKSKSKPAISVLTAKIRKRKATFRFEGTNGTVGFECKLDKKHFRSCKSPKTYKHLKPGKHEFAVRAVDSKGKHSKPATRAFRIRAKTSARH